METTNTEDCKNSARVGDTSGNRHASGARSAAPPLAGEIIATGPLNHASLAGGVLAGFAYFVLALASYALPLTETAIATVWLPNAAAVAFLLRARLSSELVFYPAIFAAGLGANIFIGNGWLIACTFAFANLVSIAAITWLARTAYEERPDMSELGTLARFVIAGGLIGPAMSASIAALAMGPDNTAIWRGAMDWFLTESLAMVIIVPSVLLICDGAKHWRETAFKALPERAVLFLASVVCLYLVFEQSAYPLLFLILPLTLLHAFRLGSLGTAVHLILVASIAIAMTWAGKGPIVAASISREVQMHLIQAFVVANFLTGLPFAAILAGRERMVRELEAGKQSLDLLASNISDAVLRYDLDDVCTYASPSVAEVLGEPASVYLGKSMLERTHQDAHDRIRKSKERLLSGESQHERFTYRRLLDREDEMPVFIEAECALERDPISGHELGIIVSARDVTERVELELLLTRARRKAEKAASAKTEFLANMSHEIRTPMNGVLGFAELMLQGDLAPEQRRNAEMIVQSGRSMMLLLNDILDLSKAEEGHLAIDHAPVDLDATLDECVALHRPAAQEKGLTITLERAPRSAEEAAITGGFEAPDVSLPHILTDGLRLRQIVLNLVSNAIKFTQSGHVRVSYVVEDEQTQVRIEDTGIGISETRLETIFLPFTQEEGSTTRRFGGTGLGLSISRQLAQLLGGRLDVSSTQGVGSVFTLTLPAKKVGVSEMGKPDEPQRGPVEMPASARILLVEDHDVNRLLALEMLKRCGQNVAIAHDGNEAISMVIDSVMRDRPFDLVLMDVQMPRCDGYAATRAIRAEGIGPAQLPIIALTANAFPEDIAAAKAAGMQSHLAKPLRFAELARSLQRWLPTQIVETPMDRDIAAPTLGGEGEEERSDIPASNEARNDHEETSGDALGTEIAGGETRDGETGPSVIHSALLRQRWQTRRSEAIDAVSEALASDMFSVSGDHQAAPRALDADDAAFVGKATAQSCSDAQATERTRLISLVHKLAGTAGIFGESELGMCAAELERALKAGSASETLEELARDLLDLAQGSASGPLKAAGRGQ